MTGTLKKPAVGAPCNGCGLCCMTQICSAGSFTMGLVKTYGDRAAGPCPALIAQDDGSYACGLVLRPRDYAPGRGGAQELRSAVKIMIGAGAGCDELGDEPSEADISALRAVQTRYVETLGPEKINRAVALWYGVKL